VTGSRRCARCHVKETWDRYCSACAKVVEPVVHQIPNVGYAVRSASTPGAWWLVEGSSCSCPATTPRCRHIRQVEAHCRLEDEKHARPVAVVNPSVFVD
jgi:hypothetical protein